MATRTRPKGCCELIAAKALPNRAVERVTKVAKALVDPTRVQILSLLARQAGPVCACDIVEHVNLSQPTVSHHLKVLKEAGLLRAGRSGLWAFYELAPGCAGALGGFSDLID